MESVGYDEACLGSLAIKGQTPSIASVYKLGLLCALTGAWGRLKLPVWSANPPYNRTLFMVSYAYNLTPFIVSYAYVMGFLSKMSQKKCPKCLTKVGEVSQPKGTKSKCA